MSDLLLTTDEVAEVLRVHPKHVYRLLKKGLPARRVLNAYMDSVRATGFKFPRDFDKE